MVCCPPPSAWCFNPAPTLVGADRGACLVTRGEPGWNVEACRLSRAGLERKCETLAVVTVAGSNLIRGGSRGHPRRTAQSSPSDGGPTNRARIWHPSRGD